MTDYRKGSMGAADQKSTRNFMIGAGIVYLLILLLLLVIPNYLHDFFKRASWGWNLAGVLLIISSYLYLLGLTDKTVARGQIIVAAIMLVLGICAACGFDFSLFQIQDRP